MPGHGSTDIQVLPQGLADGLVQRDHPVAASFYIPDPDLARGLVKGYVIPGQPHQFPHPQAALQKELEDGQIPVPVPPVQINGRNQPSDLEVWNQFLQNYAVRG